MKNSSFLFRTVGYIALAIPSMLAAQEVALNAPSDSMLAAAKSDPSAVTSTKQTTTANAVPAWETKFDRWVDLNDMNFSLRYRGVFDSNNAHEYNQGQQRSIVDGKFKFDEQGRYGIVFHGSTGKYFNWAYADFMGGGNQSGFDAEFAKATPIQQVAINAFMTPSRIAEQEASGGWSFYIRRLYMDAEPIKGLELQYGSLDIDRGSASEITTYDNDGYIDGGRVSIKNPDKFFFSEVSLTTAYFGDLYTPNFFARGDRLAHSNYHQALLRKEFLHRFNATMDYTWQDASNTYRESVMARIPETKVLDSARFEFYERANGISFRDIYDVAPGGKGWAVTGAKKNIGRVSMEAGYAHIDQHQAVLTQSESSATLTMGVNGDAYGLGTRYFVHPTIKIASYVDLTGYYTHLIGQFVIPDQILWNREALNAGFVFDIKKALFPVKKKTL